MNKLICKNCGHNVLYMGTDSYDERCEICGKKMTLQLENKREIINELVTTEKDFYSIEEIIEMDLIKSMEDNIKSIGHKRTWESIESITNAKQRLVFRSGFFKAGGKI